MAKGKPRKKCSATIKKVGNHFSVKTTCSLAKMVRRTGKVSVKRHKKPCKTKKCKENRRMSSEIRRIEAKEYHLQT